MLVAVCADHGNFSSIFSEQYSKGWLWLGLSGIVSLGIGDYFNLKMYTILSPRNGSALGTLSPASALLFGILLLDEHINFIGIIGIGITITGVMSLSLGRTERSALPDHGHGSIFSGVLFGVISAICNGAGLAFSKKGFLEQAATGNTIQPITGSFMRFLIAMIVVVLITLLNNKLVSNWKNIRQQTWSTKRTALSGIFFGPLLAVSFALSSIQYINVAVAQTIFGLVPVMTLLIAHFIYKERITKYAMAGVLIAIAGVAILIWRNEVAAGIGLH
jgi:drug/metabolite transporter (DMT)-like permease